MTSTLLHDLDKLHASYVTRVNQAVGENDMDRVHELAASYDEQATYLVAEREGKLHMLPLRRRSETRMSRLARRLHLHRAA